MAVPLDVMHHVVRVESSYNPYAIGVVGGRLVRQPKSLPEALATVQMLEQKGYNFSLGLAQVNRYNLVKYGLPSYERAFQVCANLQAGSRILAECYNRSGKDWGKSFSCYYSGDFQTGFRHGYVQKIYTSIRQDAKSAGIAYGVAPIALVGSTGRNASDSDASRVATRIDAMSQHSMEGAAVPNVAPPTGAIQRINPPTSRAYDSADVEARPPPAPPRDVILATRTVDASRPQPQPDALMAGVNSGGVVRLADLQNPAAVNPANSKGEKASSNVVDGAFVF